MKKTKKLKVRKWWENKEKDQEELMNTIIDQLEFTADYIEQNEESMLKLAQVLENLSELIKKQSKEIAFLKQQVEYANQSSLVAIDVLGELDEDLLDKITLDYIKNTKLKH